MSKIKSKKIFDNLKYIYKKYYIPLNLQKHMLEVASVAEIICDNCKEDLNKEEIIASCLIHDLGNIIKMDFDNRIYLLDEKDKQKIDFYKKKTIRT
jgi:HD superfamily phosphodiesterase